MRPNRRQMARFTVSGFSARRRAAVCVVAILLIGAGVRSAAAQVLDQVPAESLVVLKVKNLQATSTKISKLATDLNVAAFAPALADPLKNLQDQAHISQGLNTGGDLYVAFVDPTTSGETPDKSMVILIPVSDYKAFLANFPDAQTEGDISQVQLANNPQPGFVANWGTYAALSPSKTIVGKKPAGLKITAAGDKELGGKDLVVYANLATLRGILQPQLATHRDELLAQAEDTLKKNPQTEKMAPMVHAVLSQVLVVADSFLRDADAATVGLNIGDEGLSSTVMADFQPDSYLGKAFASMKNTREPLVGGIPAGKYLVFGGSVSDPAVASKLFADLVDPVAKEITAAGPDMQPINDYVTAMKAFFAANQGASFGLVAPTGALGQEALVQMISVQKGDAAAMTAALQKAYATQPELMKALGLPADTVKTAYTPNAKTVDGVSFDSYTATFTADPQNPILQAQQQQMMAMMYGPNGMAQLNASVGGNYLMTSGLSDATLTSAIASAKSGEAPLANLDPVKKVASNLPTSRAMELYIPLDQIVSTGLNYAKQFGFAVPIQLPPDLPPIGEVVSTEGSTLRIDSYVPTPLVQSLVAAGMQAAMQMNGGGGGGPPPPAGPGGGL